jgi:hypothetical protein
MPRAWRVCAVEVMRAEKVQAPPVKGDAEANRHCTISEQLFAEHHVSAGSHPSYRHEEPASPTTCITLLTGGLLVRIQPEEPFFSGT